MGDVGIREGHIAAIGRLDPAGAARVIDARGLIVAPGFIDVHTHVEDGLRKRPTADNFVLDGVTSVVTGNCGGSDVDVAKLFEELRKAGISLNVATLIGHNSVRREAMGTEERDPTPEELLRMESLVERAMRDGAVGFSTGLIYVPGTYARTPEVVALARAAARLGGVYASHIRNEGPEVFAAIDEAIQVGREAGMPVEVSHFKLSGKMMWGRSDETIGRIEGARAAGVDVTVDQYPYSASSTNLGVLLPSWALAGGQEELGKRLADPTLRAQIARETEQVVRRRAGRKRLDYAFVARCSWDPARQGKSIAQINREAGRKGKLGEEVRTVLEMMEKGGAQMVYHSMDERDVERILRFPHAMVASDGGVVEPGQGVPHPRSYGTNARVLGRYVREKRVLRLEEAVRKMTSLPAQRFSLSDRGLLRPGLAADLVVFDEATVGDRATFEAPHAPSEGIRFVLVGGVPVVEDGRHTGRPSGPHPGWARARRPPEDAGDGTAVRPPRPRSRGYWLSRAPMSVPAGVPALMRSLPGASLRKFPRLMLPSALRKMFGVRLTKSAGAHHQPLPVRARVVDPPAVRVGHVRPPVPVVAVRPLEREVVGEDVGALVELEVLLAVVPGRVVRERDAARVPVEREAVLLVAERDVAAHGVVDRDVLPAQLEAVAVAVGGRAAGAQGPVGVGDAVLDGDGADGRRCRSSCRGPSRRRCCGGRCTPGRCCRGPW